MKYVRGKCSAISPQILCTSICIPQLLEEIGGTILHQIQGGDTASGKPNDLQETCANPEAVQQTVPCGLELSEVHL